MSTEGAPTSQSSMKCFVRMDSEGIWISEFMIFGSKTKYLKKRMQEGAFF